jgi:hypothetical protein
MKARTTHLPDGVRYDIRDTDAEPLVVRGVVGLAMAASIALLLVLAATNGHLLQLVGTVAFPLLFLAFALLVAFVGRSLLQSASVQRSLVVQHHQVIVDEERVQLSAIRGVRSASGEVHFHTAWGEYSFPDPDAEIETVLLGAVRGARAKSQQPLDADAGKIGALLGRQKS